MCCTCSDKDISVDQSEIGTCRFFEQESGSALVPITSETSDRYSLDGGATWINYDGHSIELPEGDHTVTFGRTDCSQLTQEVELLHIGSAPSDSQITVTDGIISVSASPGSHALSGFDFTITRAGSVIDSGSAAAFSIDSNLLPGDVITIQVFDIAGVRSSIASVTV